MKKRARTQQEDENKDEQEKRINKEKVDERSAIARIKNKSYDRWRYFRSQPPFHKDTHEAVQLFNFCDEGGRLSYDLMIMLFNVLKYKFDQQEPHTGGFWVDRNDISRKLNSTFFLLALQPESPSWFDYQQHEKIRLMGFATLPNDWANLAFEKEHEKELIEITYMEAFTQRQGWGTLLIDLLCERCQIKRNRLTIYVPQMLKTAEPFWRKTLPHVFTAPV